MSRSSLCNYSDAYIPVSGTITITEQEIMMMRDKQMKDVNN